MLLFSTPQNASASHCRRWVKTELYPSNDYTEPLLGSRRRDYSRQQQRRNDESAGYVGVASKLSSTRPLRYLDEWKFRRSQGP